MIPYKGLIEIANEGDCVQIITEHFNGGISAVKKITDSYIWLEPIDDEELSPEYGSITHEVIIPIYEIRLIIKVNLEEIKNEQTIHTIG